jgi:CBS domain-containing protein
MAELKVRDIMQTAVVKVGPETTVRELAEVLAEHKISGVPVVGDEGRVIGVVSEADVILQDADLHFPYYLQFLDSVIYVQSVSKFETRLRKMFGIKVADIMTREVVTISPDASVYDAAALMADRKVNRVPVTEDDKLVGILTRADIVGAIAESKA